VESKAGHGARFIITLPRRMIDGTASSICQN
jgi:hypothetical protein